MPALAQFNCSYFSFNYKPETVLPLSILQCWHQLLVDIRFSINENLRKKGQSKEFSMAALSTDDLISIVIVLLIQS